MGRRCGGEAAAAAASQAIARGPAAGRRDPHARRTGRRVTQHSVAAPVRLQSPSPPRWPQHTNAWAWARATGSGFVVAGAAGLGDDLVAAGQWGADVVAGGGWSVGRERGGGDENGRGRRWRRRLAAGFGGRGEELGFGAEATDYIPWENDGSHWIEYGRSEIV